MKYRITYKIAPRFKKAWNGTECLEAGSRREVVISAKSDAQAYVVGLSMGKRNNGWSMSGKPVKVAV